tara:strand:- start:265 stop:393 length:129 start_codon:yes stop_codon:yes gene_type:complete
LYLIQIKAPIIGGRRIYLLAGLKIVFSSIDLILSGSWKLYES